MKWLIAVYWWIWLLTVCRSILSAHILTREVGALLCRWPKCWYFYVMWQGGLLATSLLRRFWVQCQYIHKFLHLWFHFNQFTIPDLEDNLSNKFLFVDLSSVPNRYTFTCPYCNCPNFDQDGLVEHCTSLHARDARQVVGNSLVCPLHEEFTF